MTLKRIKFDCGLYTSFCNKDIVDWHDKARKTDRILLFNYFVRLIFKE